MGPPHPDGESTYHLNAYGAVGLVVGRIVAESGSARVAMIDQSISMVARATIWLYIEGRALCVKAG